VVVNAGTAITIDCLGKEGTFIGGIIIPGLHLMHESLNRHAMQVNIHAGTGDAPIVNFPTNTQDAVAAGCLNAVTGAIHSMLKRLEKDSGWLPKLVMSGGDAHKIAQVLKSQDLKLGVKQVIMIENLVLQGLVLLAKE
jgi:pantothenate kinase type III